VCKTSSMNVQHRVDLICLHMGTNGWGQIATENIGFGNAGGPDCRETFRQDGARARPGRTNQDVPS
jgi:hypothetical protein